MAKKALPKNVSVVATHHGFFHADDVLAYAILTLAFGNKLKLVRSRDPKKYEAADVVFDIGHVYDPKTLRFDHHQKGGAGKRANGIPYSSAGLVWKHIGPCITGEKKVWEAVDKNLIQPIDAEDNGIAQSDAEYIAADLKPNSLGAMLATMCPMWDEPSGLTDYTKAFKQAAKITQVFLERAIRSAEAKEAAKKEVRKAIKASKKQIMILDCYLPWKSIVAKDSSAKAKDLLYVVYPNIDKTWGCIGVLKEGEVFERKKYLPKEWAGLKGKALQEVSEIEDAVFCHDALFVCGAATKESAIKMAEIARDAK